MKTFTTTPFRLADLDAVTDITVNDILIGLYNTTRFAGQIPLNAKKWTVLHHSVFAAKMAEKAEELADTVSYIMLHDCVEAFLGDIIHPIKENLFIATAEGFIPLSEWEDDVKSKIINNVFGLSLDNVNMDAVDKFDQLAGEIEEKKIYGSSVITQYNNTPAQLNMFENVFIDMFDSIYAHDFYILANIFTHYTSTGA